MLQEIELIVGVITLIITSIGIISWFRKWDVLKSIFSRKRLRYPSYRFIKYKLQTKGKYIYDYRENSYEFIDRTHMQHIKNFKVKNYTPNIRFFEDRYNWSKPGAECKPKNLYNHQEIAYTWKENNGCSYLIKLERYYAIREIFDVGIVIDLVDEEKQSQLYLQAAIYEKTKLLRLKLKFNGNLIPKEIKLSIYKDYHTQPELRDVKELLYNNREGCILYEEKYPLINHRYEITWEFNE